MVQPWSQADVDAESIDMEVRRVSPAEVAHLAKLWHDGWQDAHARILPAELARARTLESFKDRLDADLADIRAVGPLGAAKGFCIVKDDELYQLFVAAPSRGRGAAAALIRDAEARIAESGARSAWLACAIGNERAARFYERCGWSLVGTMESRLETPDGVFSLEVWRYEKPLIT